MAQVVALPNGRTASYEIIGSQLVMPAGCGHIPCIEAPAEYRQAVMDFLRRW
jgi:pimeloyl-ACP methyl ester carboxylesterase